MYVGVFQRTSKINFFKNAYLEDPFNVQWYGTKMNSSMVMLKPMKVMMNIKSSRPEVFSYEFFEISKNTFSYKKPPVAVSGMCKMSGKLQ